MSNIVLGHIEADTLVPIASLTNNMCSISAIIKAMSSHRLTESELKDKVSEAISAMIVHIIDENRVLFLNLRTFKSII